MRVVCQGPGCGQVFETIRRTAKYHNDTCRQRARRHPDLRGTPPQVIQPDAVDPYLEAATRAELETLGRTDTAAGRRALMLARRLDNSVGEGLSAVAAAMREHAAAMGRATADGPRKDPVEARSDEVAERRRTREVASPNG
jgi:hypothetical protein